jgi:hypothetical protein
LIDLVRTTIKFSLTYKEAVKLDSSLAPASPNNEIQTGRAREQYDFHPHFDIYSIGATIRELLRVAGINN